MKNIFFLLLLFSLQGFGQHTQIVQGAASASATALKVASTTTLQAVTRSGKLTAIVTDVLAGGTFNYSSESLTDDNGITFPATGGGHWVRDVSQAGGSVDISWFGATHNTDIAPILTYLFFSTNYRKIIIPNDTFYIGSQIGYPLRTLYNEANVDSTTIKRDLEIIGVGSPLLLYTGVATQSMFALGARGNLSINNLIIDGNNVAVMGIHAGWFTTTGTVSVENCKLRNFFIPDDTFFGAVGIRVFGNLSMAYFNKDSVHDIHAATDAITVNTAIIGIEVRNTALNYVKNLVITNSFVGNVYSEDTSFNINQEGAHYSQYPYIQDTFSTHALIQGNTFFNCRTRFLKVQAKNTYIHNNTFRIDSTMYVSPNQGGSIDLQFSEGTITDNNFLYFYYCHNIVANFTNRDTMPSRQIFDNNKIRVYGANSHINYVVQNYNVDNNARLGNTHISNNTVSADSIKSFCNIIFGGTHRENRVIVSGNTIEKLYESLIKIRYAQTTPSNFVHLSLNDNVNKGSDVPLVTSEFASYELESRANIGFTDSSAIFSKGVTLKGLYTSLDTTNRAVVKKTNGQLAYMPINQVGQRLGFLDAGGAGYYPQWWNNQDSGVSAIGVGISDGTSNNRFALFVDYANSVQGITSTYSNGGYPFVFRDAVTERWRVSTNGHFSIGTTNADSVLNVSGGAKITGGLKLTGLPTSTASTDSFLVKTSTGIVAYNGQAASTSTRGFLTSTDWNTFNNKQASLLQAAGTGITIGGASIGRSGSSFATIGFNVALTASSGVYNYQTTNFADIIDVTSGDIVLYTAPSGTAGTAITFTQKFKILNAGGIGVGVASPSANFHIKAGVATANGAPFKLNPGTILTTPETGALETNTNNELYYSNSTTAASRGFVNLGRYASTATSLTADATQNTIDVTATGQTITLPTAVGINGRTYTIVYTAASGTATIATTSSQTFLNITSTPTTLTLSAPAAGAITSYTLQATNAHWIVIAKVKNE